MADAVLEAGLAGSLSQQTMRTLGNAGMQALLGVHRPPPRNSELSVGVAGSAIEREADRIAEEAMRAPGVAATVADPGAMRSPPMSRASPRGSISMQASMQTSIQARHEAPANPGARRAPPVVPRALNAAGRPLDAPVRREMESRFGVDFGGVRIHTDALSAASARAIGARAYTHGEDIVFGAGRYRPDTMPGKTLLAHELAHVLQGGGVVHRDGEDAAAQAQSAESGWLDMLWSVLQTIGGGLLGEFNEDAGFAEIGVDLGVSLIPYLDQASDVRDLAAHLYFMCFREDELSRPMRWVGLAFTLIGLFPEIGSAIKGASKLLIRGGRSVLEHLDDLMRIVRRALGSASSTLDDFVAMIRRSWPEIARFGRQMWFSKLAEVRRMLEEVPTFLRSQVQGLIDLIDDIWRRSPRMLDEAMESIDEMMRAGFEALGIRVDGPVFAVAGGPPGFFMTSHGDEIAEEMNRLSGGGRSVSDWAGHTLDEAEDIADELVEAGAASMQRMERHHGVFVYLLNAIASSRAGRRVAVAGETFRAIVDDLFPQRLIDLEPGVHGILHMQFWRIFDEIFEPERFMQRLRRGLSESDISFSSIVERAGAPGMLRRMQELTEHELLDIIEETYIRIFRENPSLISARVQREILEQIDEVRRYL
ncbi:MAG: DUF4157 domain-containing protein [Lysobacter sp.]|nr:DUF4157 domain-containing protein [Lysobacter sp.]